jgi:glycine/D-amino acid oxidase-like deaminating enzyme
VRRLQVGQVVLAVGPSAPELAPRLRPYVRPVRAQMLATEAGPEGDIPVPVYSHQGGYYVRQLDDGRVLAGGGRHRNRDAEETKSDTTTPAVQAAIERHLHTHFPWTQHRAVQQRWSGTMGFSPDGRPVIGPLPEAPGSFFATGFTGHGMGYGFHVGRLLADLVCGDDRPDAYDLFAASRFEETPQARAAPSSPAG